jgi:uncharacterized protein (DUF2141 family)
VSIFAGRIDSQSKNRLLCRSDIVMSKILAAPGWLGPKLSFHAGVLALCSAIGLGLTVPAASSAATYGPQAAVCNGNKSGVLVTVSGFKKRVGTVSVRLYANNKANFLERNKWLERIDVPVAKTGSMSICVPVAKPGSYAISVRHDMNSNRKSDKADGGGLSGNPNMGLTDVLLKRKPSLAKSLFTVGATTAKISVTLNYVDGLSFGPVK